MSDRMRFTEDAQGPGRVFDRRGQAPPSWLNRMLNRVGAGFDARFGTDEAPPAQPGHPQGGRPVPGPSGEGLDDLWRGAVGYRNRKAVENMTGVRDTDDLLTAALDRFSAVLAGGQRIHPSELLPGVDDPLEGLIDEEFRGGVDPYDWFDPTQFLDANGDLDLSGIWASSGREGKAGKGMDWFRGGEAPNNLSNRAHPLYKARAEFAVALNEAIEERYGVNDQGSAGHRRAWAASHANPGGPSSNSDHYSGGAIDYFGTKEQLDELHAFLITQPYVSFIRWQSESHYDHLHVSFDLGWVAENFYSGQAPPPVAGSPTSAAARNRSYNPLPTTSPRQPSQGPRQPVSPTRRTGGPQEY